MPRVKKKKKPLRGSVRQNTATAKRGSNEESRPWFGFGARLALLILVTIAIIVSTAWLWRSEWPHRQARRATNAILRLTQKTGFAVTDVMVQGRHYTNKQALLEALGIKAGAPIVLFSPEQAHENIMALPWSESVSVLRSMPNKIIVRLSERQPMARWQHNGKTVVIDRDGKELTEAQADQFLNLPLVVGDAAPEQTKDLLSSLQAFPVVARLLKAAVRVGERRWNFYIQPNLLIRLPEDGIDDALVKLTTLIQEQKITDRNVVAVDLRLPDRMVIEPGTQPKASQFGEMSE